MKKLNLTIEPENNYILLGIVCQKKIFKLAWLLNNTGYYNFKRIDDFYLTLDTNTETTNYMRMENVDDENHLCYQIIENKNEKKYLSNELKSMQYFLIVKGGLDFFDVEEMIKKIKKIDEIIFVSAIKNDKVKSSLSFLIE